MLKNVDVKYKAYDSLKNYVDETNQTFLLNELKKERNRTNFNNILTTLGTQNITAPEVETTILKFAKLNDDENLKVPLLNVLKHFPNENTKEFALKLILENTTSSATAIRILLDIGYPPKEIADIVVPFLLSENLNIASTTLSYLTSGAKELGPYLPTTKELLEKFVEIKYHQMLLPNSHWVVLQYP